MTADRRRPGRPLPADPWPSDELGVVQLPSGRRIRGRPLAAELPPGLPPTFAVQLAARIPAETAWERAWIPWRDFWVPADPASATRVLQHAHARAAGGRVEIGCARGVGRTGTALAAMGVLEGMSPDAAVAWARAHYHRRAVEVPWQRRYLGYVERLAGTAPSAGDRRPDLC